MTEKLLPCPFCPDGGRPYFNPHTNDSTDSGSRMAYVGCASCGVSLKAANFPTMQGGWNLSKDILAIWNTRATSAPVSKEVEEAIADAKKSISVSSLIYSNGSGGSRSTPEGYATQIKISTLEALIAAARGDVPWLTREELVGAIQAYLDKLSGCTWTVFDAVDALIDAGAVKVAHPLQGGDTTTKG